MALKRLASDSKKVENVFYQEILDQDLCFVMQTLAADTDTLKRAVLLIRQRQAEVSKQAPSATRT
eukprot:11040942-Prorocentrum_lima.AAC.1